MKNFPSKREREREIEMISIALPCERENQIPPSTETCFRWLEHEKKQTATKDTNNPCAFLLDITGVSLKTNETLRRSDQEHPVYTSVGAAAHTLIPTTVSTATLHTRSHA